MNYIKSQYSQAIFTLKALLRKNSFYFFFSHIRIYDGTRYLAMFGSGKNGNFYERIRYLISLKSDITYTFSRNATSLWGISTF